MTLSWSARRPAEPNVVIVGEARVELSLLWELEERHPEVGVVVLAFRPSRAYGAQLIGAGASCLSAESSAADILETLRRVARGGQELVVPADRRRDAQATVLTPRERDVLDAVRRGLSPAEIAHELSISVETARTHTAKIRHKLGVQRTSDLVDLNTPDRDQE